MEAATMPVPDKGLECDVCYEEPSDGMVLARCSTCKNAFYRSSACQTKGWKTHKFNCSALPKDTIPPEIGPDPERAAEMSRVLVIVKDIVDAHKAAQTDKERKLALAALSQLSLSPRFSYNRIPPLHDTFTARTPLIYICRLYLIDFIASASAEQRLAVNTGFANMTIPSGATRLYGPKFTARPGELSPGEYEMIMQVSPLWMMGAGIKVAPTGGSNLDGWMQLAVLRKLGWNTRAPKARN